MNDDKRAEHLRTQIQVRSITSSMLLQGSRWRAIRVKKLPCEGWLRFLVGQKRSSSRLVILKSRPMSPPAYFLHLSFIKMSISCTCLLKSIVSVIKYSRTSLARTRRDCKNLFEPQRSHIFREKINLVLTRGSFITLW